MLGRAVRLSLRMSASVSTHTESIDSVFPVRSVSSSLPPHCELATVSVPVAMLLSTDSTPHETLTVHITNIGSYVRPEQISTFLKDNGIVFAGVKKSVWSRYGHVIFNTITERDAALVTIPLLTWRENKLVVRLQFQTAERDSAPSAHRSGSSAAVLLKRKREHAGSSDDDGVEQRGTVPKDVNDVVTPWRSVSYAHQLRTKQNVMEEVLRVAALRIRAHILRKCELKWIEKHSAKRSKALQSALDATPCVEETMLTSQTPAGTAVNDELERTEPRGCNALGEVSAAAPEAFSSFPSGLDPEKLSKFMDNRRNLVRNIPPELAVKLQPWLVSSVAENDGMASRLLPIIASPDVFGYRNKASFTIGRDSAGEPCVGSRVSSFADGSTVAKPDGAVHLPPPILALADVLNRFVRSSPLLPYDTTTHEGCWRSATVRWSPSLREAMVVISLQPGKSSVEKVLKRPGVPLPQPIVSSEAVPLAVHAMPPTPTACTNEAVIDTQAGVCSGSLSAAGSADKDGVHALLVSAELERLCDLLTGDSLLCVVSIYGQSYSGLSQPPPNHPHQLLYGRATITEEMCGMRFNVGPSAFFQVNTRAAEILYTVVRDFAVTGSIGDSNSGTQNVIRRNDLAVLDVCCGTGTIGIICSPFVARVVGVELSEGAIQDAKANALLNRIENAVFVCSRAEDVMPRLLGLASAPIRSQPQPEAKAATGTGSSIASATGSLSESSSHASGHGSGLTRTLPASASLSVAVPLPVAAGSASGCDTGTVTTTGSASAGAATGSASALTDSGTAVTVAVPPHEGTSYTSESSGHASGTGSGAGGMFNIRKVVAIVDPPRSGLHMEVIKTIRTCKLIKRVVYVSCNPAGSFLEDCVRLCAPQTDEKTSFARGPNFRLKVAVPVDLFPHTPHTELVAVFERD